MGSKAMPRTPADKKMGMRHLKVTIALDRRKIADHRAAAAKAKRGSNLYSAAYHEAHAEGHIKDIKERKKAYQKYSRAKMKVKNGK